MTNVSGSKCDGLRMLTSSSACWFVFSRARLWDLHVCRASLCFLVSSCFSATHKKQNIFKSLWIYSHSNSFGGQCCCAFVLSRFPRVWLDAASPRSWTTPITWLGCPYSVQWLVQTTELRTRQDWVKKSCQWLLPQPSHQWKCLTTTVLSASLHKWLLNSCSALLGPLC